MQFANVYHNQALSINLAVMKMKRVNTFAILVVLSALVIGSKCANILGVFPLQLKSHYIMFQPIMAELARRGHNVTVISQYPTKEAQANFTDVDVTGCSPLTPLFSLELAYSIFSNLLLNIHILLFAGIDLYTNIPGGMFECKPFKQFLNSDNSYDLVITELFNGDVTLGFVSKYQAAHAAFVVGSVYPWGADRMGNPSNPAYIPYPHTNQEFDRFHPTFYQRLFNTVIYLYARTYYYYYSYKHEELARKTFGSDMPSLDEIAKNTSMVLSFSHFSFKPPVPLVPGIVEIAGVQIKKAKPLPQDIQKFIDESEHGIIYFCMGSLLQSETMSDSKRIAFLNAFSQLPQRVIWRWEGDLPGKTDRIYISSWLPQRDILAHPKVKMFISHGGGLGVNEAIYESVPILGIPIFGDHTLNIRMLKSYGAAELLNYPDINNDTVLAKIKQVLQPEYSKNMKKVSEIFKDRPLSALDTAVYWIEYVIRHKGARHLRTAAVDMPLYQYLLLDVISFLLAVSLSVVFLVYYFFKKFLSLFVRKPKAHSKKKN